MKDLGLIGGEARPAPDPFPPDEIHFRLRGKPLFCPEKDDPGVVVEILPLPEFQGGFFSEDLSAKGNKDMLGDRIEKLFPLLFLGERDADPLLDSLHGERCVCEDRLPVGLRVEQQEEDLLLVHVNGSLPGSREENRGTAGKEGVLLLTLDHFS